MTKSLVAACLIAGLALAGCGVPPGPGDTPAPSTGTTGAPAMSETSGPVTSGTAPESALPDLLSGRSFQTRDAGDVTGLDLVGDSKLTISFGTDQDGNLSINADAGCNQMGGPVAWDGGTMRPRDGFFRTEMACEGLMDQEDWFFAQLNAGLTFALDGDTLTATSVTDYGTLREKRVTISFTDTAVVHPDVPIGGPTWRLDGIVQGTGNSGSASSVPLDLTASLTISRDPADGHLRLDVFDGLTWLSVPGGFYPATGEYSGSVTIEPTAFATPDDLIDGTPDPLSAKAGTVRVTGGLGGDDIGCATDHPDCRVAEIALLGSDFTFETHQDRLTVTGTGAYAGHGLTFVVDPTAPAPDLNTYLAEADNPLLGKTFELTRTFTDAGGADHKHADATLRLTFGADRITADGSCGPFSYDDVRYIADPVHTDQLTSVALGEPSISGCVIGDDPPMPPDGTLMYGTEVSQVAGGDGSEMWLSTGYVAWYFRPAE